MITTNIMRMTRQDFDAVPRLDDHSDWEKLAPNGRLEFRSFVIIPIVNDDGTIDIHDSGFGLMEFFLVGKQNEPIIKVGGGSDVINLDGIGGYGDHANWLRFNGVPRSIPIHGWSIDLLPCGYFNVWTRRTLFLRDEYICSNFEVFSEDQDRR